MTSNNRIVTLGQLKGPGLYASSASRRFLCGDQSCPGGGSKARPDDIQRHAAKVHGVIINYATVRVQEVDEATQITTVITAAQYVDRIWATAGLPVPPAQRFRKPGPIAVTSVANATVTNSTSPVNASITTTQTESRNGLSIEQMRDPRIAMFRSLVEMTTRLGDWLVTEGTDRSELQAFADRVAEEAIGADTESTDGDEHEGE